MLLSQASAFYVRRLLPSVVLSSTSALLPKLSQADIINKNWFSLSNFCLLEMIKGCFLRLHLLPACSIHSKLRVAFRFLQYTAPPQTRLLRILNKILRFFPTMPVCEKPDCWYCWHAAPLHLSRLSKNEQAVAQTEADSSARKNVVLLRFTHLKSFCFII